jgi:hypothetical protein
MTFLCKINISDIHISFSEAYWNKKPKKSIMRAMNGEKSMRTSLARKMTQASAVPQLFSRPVRQPSDQGNEEAPALGLATKNKCYFIASIKNKEHVVLMLVVEVILCWSIFFCIGTYGNHRPMKELKRKDFIFF